jgi:hypothetical protein
MGFVVGDFDVSLRQPSEYLEIRIRRGTHSVEPKAVGIITSLRINETGTNEPAIVPIWPDHHHPYNQIAACIHRFGCSLPTVRGRLIWLFLRYSRTFIREMLTPLAYDAIRPFEEWLASRSYSGKRKQYIARLTYDLRQTWKGDVGVEGFIKAEPVPKPRMINTFNDDYKGVLGRLFSAVDASTFEQLSRFFVKGTDPRDWPDRLAEMFGDHHVLGTDYSSFEAHHVGVYAIAVRDWMRHMLSRVTANSALKELVDRLVMGENKINTADLKVKIPQRLMSGHAWTSSANGMLNLMLSSFMAAITVNPLANPLELVQWVKEKFVGIFEGDDGLTLDYGITQTTIDSLGLMLKLERAEHFSRAGFCSIICDPDSRVVIKDPMETLSKLFVLPARYVCRPKVHQAMLRAKALSLKYNFGQTPVVGPVCDWILHETRSVDVRKFLDDLDERQRDYVEKALQMKVWLQPAKPQSTARQLVAEYFGLPLFKQLEIENACVWGCRNPELNLTIGQDHDQLEYRRVYVVSQPQDFAPPALTPPPCVADIWRYGLRAIAVDREARRLSSAYRRAPPIPDYELYETW